MSDEQFRAQLVERIERVERAVGLRPPDSCWPNGWDSFGRYWGDWVDPYSDDQRTVKERLAEEVRRR